MIVVRLLDPEDEGPVSPLKHQELFTQGLNITAQKTWIFSSATWWTANLITYFILFTLFMTGNGIKSGTCFCTSSNKTATLTTNCLQLDPKRTKIIKSISKLFRGWCSLTWSQELSQLQKCYVYQIYIRVEHVHHDGVAWWKYLLLASGGGSEGRVLVHKNVGAHILGCLHGDKLRK